MTFPYQSKWWKLDFQLNKDQGQEDEISKLASKEAIHLLSYYDYDYYSCRVRDLILTLKNKEMKDIKGFIMKWLKRNMNAVPYEVNLYGYPKDKALEKKRLVYEKMLDKWPFILPLLFKDPKLSTKSNSKLLPTFTFNTSLSNSLSILNLNLPFQEEDRQLNLKGSDDEEEEMEEEKGVRRFLFSLTSLSEKLHLRPDHSFTFAQCRKIHLSYIRILLDCFEEYHPIACEIMEYLYLKDPDAEEERSMRENMTELLAKGKGNWA